MGWVYLFWASGFEVIFAVSLKYTAGYSKPLPSTVATIFAMVSIISLAKALNSIPVGVAYAIWTGLGTLGINLMGMMLFREPLGGSKALYILMILGGVLGLHSGL
ncbi:small multidrug resistance protein [Gloeomargarita lithophora Alchichica-D10]|uniref:Small multidrug resistance protein n=1 Tax=Gloeomargarita lithophora Alchichica-D10 TaxID=1188229 RepID=A0A1J0ACT9_9CYAN|nr:multidrug efflux SMR transporter [Gloeomargarita lithophora]APB33728.1 small multidrug resistance protein [Gloeomargarita lithophora Alchichica-D10]